MKGEKTFCPIPWIFQAVRSNGDIRVCCQANVTKNRGVVRKEDGTAYNAGIDDLSEARNAQLMKDIRKNMLSSKWSEECGRCMKEEENGLTSRRQYERVQWKYSIIDALKNTKPDGSIDVNKSPTRYYDLRFGNFCNLKCRMCGPSDSNAWFEDWIKLTGKTSFNDTSGEVTIEEVNGKLCAVDFDWPNSEMFWTQLERNIQYMEHVYFAGGEPMLIERHYEFLQKCIDSGYAENIMLEYNTNGTTLPPRVINLWKKFKEVRLGVSVDGMGAVLEYQRYPVKWNKVLKNLNTIDKLPNNIKAWIAFTVTAYNVEHMIDFMKWKIQESGWTKINNSAIKPFVTYHVAHNPPHLNIRVLPDRYKDRITQQFDNFIQWCEDENLDKKYIIAAQGIKNGVCSYMNNESYYNTHWKEFIEYSFSLDKIRGEKLIDTVPALGEYVNG
jgi:MoaA/NifB/PqqE/SkfB family radical SAM enzyme